MPGITAEYRIIETGAGLVDRSGRGRLRFDGADALAFLQNLLTNDVASMDERRGIYAALLTPQGRMVADFRIFRRGAAVIADVAPGSGAALAARLDALVFSEDVRVTDATDLTAVITVVGAAAPAVVARAFELEVGTLAALGPLGQVPAGQDAWIVRSDEADKPMLDIWIDAAASDNVAERMRKCGAQDVSPAVVDLLRIEAGRPAFGIDMTTETIPLEAGVLERGISTAKGCYVGQEVIVRVLHRGGGRVAKRLVRIAFEAGSEGEPVPGAGSSIAAGGREVGRITSAAWSPGAGCVVALGYVARDAAAEGTTLDVASAGGVVSARITGLAG